jgi:hypothetical protein
MLPPPQLGTHLDLLRGQTPVNPLMLELAVTLAENLTAGPIVLGADSREAEDHPAALDGKDAH